MVLNRLGNKKKLAQTINKYFPQHDLYIELFFGAGGMFFNKPKAKYNILNDVDSDVYNLYQVVRHNSEAFLKEWNRTPLHMDLWNYWRKNQEPDPLYKAVRFLTLSNFGYMGKPETLRFGFGGNKTDLFEKIEQTNAMFFDVKFMNCDFREVPRRVSIKTESEKRRAFIYSDPPYLDTDNNYSQGFKKVDVDDHFELLQNTGVKWAMSEFDHPYILQKAKEYNLQVIEIGERQALKGRRKEILIINYSPVIK